MMKIIKNLMIAAMLILNFQVSAKQDARSLIEKVVKAVGGTDQLRALKDVEYEYTFKSKEKGIKDVSLERYIFDGEYSYATYREREYFVLPQLKGDYSQYFDGTKTVSKINKNLITEEQSVYIGHFFRKTNFYWFNMMYKLLDPGVNYKTLPKRIVNNKKYHIVEMTFDTGVGETSDRYVLYINPENYLIDQFLFTVKGFGFTDPFLMKLEYEQINGLQLSTYRKYAPANWQGEVIKEEWNEQISSDIKFNNGFTSESIQKL